MIPEKIKVFWQQVTTITAMNDMNEMIEMIEILILDSRGNSMVGDLEVEDLV